MGMKGGEKYVLVLSSGILFLQNLPDNSSKSIDDAQVSTFIIWMSWNLCRSCVCKHGKGVLSSAYSGVTDSDKALS